MYTNLQSRQKNVYTMLFYFHEVLKQSKSINDGKKKLNSGSSEVVLGLVIRKGYKGSFWDDNDVLS